MRCTALVALLLSCIPPCPDTYPLCIEHRAPQADGGEPDGGSCRAWPASCCMGIAACSKGTLIDYDAGACAIVEVPAERKISCQ